MLGWIVCLRAAQGRETAPRVCPRGLGWCPDIRSSVQHVLTSFIRINVCHRFTRENEAWPASRKAAA